MLDFLWPLHSCSINCGCSLLPGCIAKEKRYVLPFLVSTVGLFLAGGLFGYRMVYPASLDFLIGYGPMLPAADHDWGIYKAVSNDHHRARVDFRNAHSRLLPRSDAGDYGSLDVAQSAIFHTCHFCSRSNRYTCHRHLEHVPFCCPDGRLYGMSIGVAWVVTRARTQRT